MEHRYTSFTTSLLLTFSAVLSPGPDGTASAAWLGQFAASYDNRGTINPPAGPPGLTSSATFTTSYYRYPFWTLNAVAGTTYYFDLCGSSGGSLTNTRLRIHDGTYGLYSQDPATQVIQNVNNGCSGTGSGFSRIIWTCPATGTYYLESAASTNSTFWGVSATQTVVLRYYTLPSSVTSCSGAFNDMGGNGTNGATMGYGNNENWQRTLQPSYPGNLVQVTFSSFSTEAGADYLFVYDGNSINAPQVPGSPFSGSAAPGTITSTAADGSLTFRFTSDGGVVSSGWAATVACICIDPEVSITGPSSVCEGGTATLTAVLTAGAGEYQWQLDGGDLPGATGTEQEVSEQGTYTVVVTNPGGGCSGTSAPFGFVVDPAPSADFTFTVGVDGATVTFNASVPGGTYSWDFGDGTTGSGASVVHTYTSAGSYDVVLTATNGCGTVTASQEVLSTVGIAELEDAIGLELYPDPASRRLTVVVALPGDLYLFDASGALVVGERLPAGTHIIPIGHLAAGVHGLLYRTSEGSARRKVVVVPQR